MRYFGVCFEQHSEDAFQARYLALHEVLEPYYIIMPPLLAVQIAMIGYKSISLPHILVVYENLMIVERDFCDARIKSPYLRICIVDKTHATTAASMRII